MKPWAKRTDAPDTKRLRGRAGMERRARWLAKFPLCKACEEASVVTLGTIVDHVTPLFQGGKDDESNLQTLCTKHHDAKSLREKGGKPQTRIGPDGWPVGG